MRILLVEDDPDLSRALQSGLERQGVVADVVGSLAEAAIALREPVHQLMLLDRQLPDGDGVAFVATARAAPEPGGDHADRQGHAVGQGRGAGRRCR